MPVAVSEQVLQSGANLGNMENLPLRLAHILSQQGHEKQKNMLRAFIAIQPESGVSVFARAVA